MNRNRVLTSVWYIKIGNFKFIVLLFIIFSFSFSFSQLKAQNFDKRIVDSLIISTLNSRIDLILSDGYKYIEPNEYTERIRKNFKTSVYKFPDRDELFKITYKNNRHLILYRIVPEVISKDTIDINFGTVNLKVKKGIFFKNGLYFKKAEYSISCSGSNGYQPTFRYVFDKELNEWKNGSDQEESDD